MKIIIITNLKKLKKFKIKKKGLKNKNPKFKL